MAISLTNSAAERVRNYLESKGWSGYSYVINSADEVREADIVFEDKGVKVVVDPDALAMIDGTEVDFVKKGLNEAFSFRNPNVTGECGCGESFNI